MHESFAMSAGRVLFRSKQLHGRKPAFSWTRFCVQVDNSYKRTLRHGMILSSFTMKRELSTATEGSTAPMTKRQHLPLDGILVVSLEQAIAAPLCTRHLADLGAQVIKIERRAEGDFARHYDTRVRGSS